MTELTPRQRRFAQEYLVDLNATKAAIRAGYSPKTAKQQGARLLTNADVQAFVAAAGAKREERTAITADRVLTELAQFAFADIREAFDEHGRLRPIHELPEQVARAMASVEVEELFEGRGDERVSIGVVRKVKFWDKPRGLEMLGKHLKMFVERREISGPGGEHLIPRIPLKGLSDATLAQLDEVLTKADTEARAAEEPDVGGPSEPR